MLNRGLEIYEENREAYAAKMYWKALFGKEFVRSKDLPGINSFLNYGYAIMRASMARAVSRL